MLEATVSGERSYQVEVHSEGITLNGQSHVPDIQQHSPRIFHSIHHRAGRTIELLEANYERKTFTFKIRGRIATVQFKDELDLMVEKLGMAQALETTITEITAPMPGLIVGLSVESGQEINQGDSVLTLEAMKMENVIKSPTDGTIETVHVKAGDSVDKNQVLVSFAK